MHGGGFVRGSTPPRIAFDKACVMAEMGCFAWTFIGEKCEGRIRRIPVSAVLLEMAESRWRSKVSNYLKLEGS